jgi:putative membrane protein
VFAMTALQLLFDHLHSSPVPRRVRELSQRGGRHDIAQLKVRARRPHLPQKDATVRAAERFSYWVRGTGIKPHQRHLAGVAVHYGFGAMVGGAYGLSAERYPFMAIASGLPFGAGVWLLAEEVALPATRLSDMPGKYPLRDHLNALASHLVYGMTTEFVRKRVLQSLHFLDRAKDRCCSTSLVSYCDQPRRMIHGERC